MMVSVPRGRVSWALVCCATLVAFGSPSSEAAQEWPGGGRDAPAQPTPPSQDAPPGYSGQGGNYPPSQADPGKWNRYDANNPRWGRGATGTSAPTTGGWRPRDGVAQGGQPFPPSGEQQPTAWSGSVPARVPFQESRVPPDAVGSFPGPGMGFGSPPLASGGEWSPLTDTGLLGIGVVANGADGLRRYLEDLKKWLAIKENQNEAWEGFVKAASGFVSSRVNPLTNIPDIHLNSVDWAKKRSETLREWLQLREAVVAAYDKLYVLLDADQREHADRLSGFFRQGGG
ncbi:MAG: hypothetical protein HQL66_06385 [Magnetococcales bacterium]|nr:hypothetical protein [Magnetococcales bacterium]